MTSEKIPYENGISLTISGVQSPRIKKASYVLRVTPDMQRENVIFSMWERKGEERKLTHFQIFHRLVEDIIVYDPYGNVIMTINDINENTFKEENEIRSFIEVTPDIIKEGGEKYNNLPKFNDLVMNMPESRFVIENKSAIPIIVIEYTNIEDSLGAWSNELDAGRNITFSRIRYNEVLDPITLFYLQTKDMNIYNTSGNLILAFNDVKDRLVRTVEGSETYGHKTYTITITDQDLLVAEEKYRNIDKIDIKEELENIRNIIKSRPPLLDLDKDIDTSIFNGY
jgi:hypothetical protein